MRNRTVYIDSIELTNVRSFGKTQRLEFAHPDREWAKRSASGESANGHLPKPRLPNVTLLLGDNGAGKTTALRALAAVTLGPTASSTMRDSSIVRRDCSRGRILADLQLHPQDDASVASGAILIAMIARGESVLTATEWFENTDDLNESSWPTGLTSADSFSRLDSSANEPGRPKQEDVWRAVYESQNDAFFAVGYGATRRVEFLDKYDPGARSKVRRMRDQRIMSLFEESFSLIPLASWLPQLRSNNPGRFKQVINLLNLMLKPGHYEFTGEQDARGDYLFRRGSLNVPFQSLSDGYRAFIGWVADLLHHVCFGCPKGKKLIDSCGVVLVDEIDLHLHPKWQMKVVETVSRALPKMQFILTSHSPLVASSLEWMNVVTLKTNRSGETVSKRYQDSIHGLDADQILLTDLFGLKSTRAESSLRHLERLKHEATLGGIEAKRRYLRAVATGSEPDGRGENGPA